MYLGKMKKHLYASAIETKNSVNTGCSSGNRQGCSLADNSIPEAANLFREKKRDSTYKDKTQPTPTVSIITVYKEWTFCNSLSYG